MKWKLIILIVLLINCCSLIGQSRVSGTVKSGESKTPIENVLIQNKLGNEWAITDVNGNYSINLNSSNYILLFTHTGLQTREFSHKDINSNKLNITLSVLDLNLDEIEVTAVSVKSKAGSAIRIDEAAIEQTQAFTLTDVLQQLPGQTITPPNLATPNSLTLRTAKDFKRFSPSQSTYDNAFGLAIEVDGQIMSNDAEMQAVGNLGSFDTSGFDNSSKGLDLRQISVDNIESVEVVEGVADAEYGNLTTGIIKIRTKDGITPYTVKAKINEGTTSVNFTKGWNLGSKIGELNINAGYLNSNHDPRNSLTAFNRVNTNLTWKYNKGNHFKNKLKLNFSGNFDDVKYDADTDDGRQQSKFRKDRKYSLTNETNFQLNKKYVDNLKSTVSLSYGRQHSYSQSFFNIGGSILPTSLSTGLSNGAYTPLAYLQKRETFGEPIYGNVQLKASKTLSNKNNENNLSAGVTITYTDNVGKGNSIDPNSVRASEALRATSGVEKTSARSINFANYVKPQINYGLFLQNNFLHEFKNGNEIYLKTGVRYDEQNNNSSISPRLNVGYELNEDWSIRAGIGYSTKTQSLHRLYPGDSFYDIVIRDFRTDKYAWNLIQTYRYKNETQELKPTSAWKYEAGTNLNLNWVRGSLTAYYSKREDAIRAGQFKTVAYAFPEIEFYFEDPQNKPPTYQVTNYRTLTRTVSQLINEGKDEDYGANLLINIRKIRSINTSFNINAAYVYSKNDFQTGYRLLRNKNDNNDQFYYGMYEVNSSPISNLNSKITASHHLSKIALLVSITAEQFWFQKIHPVNGSTYSDDYKTKYPIGYVTKNNQRVIFTDRNEGRKAKYEDLWTSTISNGDPLNSIVTTPMYSNYHLRVSKSFKNGLSTSLHVVNFINNRQLIKDDIEVDGILQEGSSTVVNKPINFGGSVTYKFN